MNVHETVLFFGVYLKNSSTKFYTKFMAFWIKKLAICTRKSSWLKTGSTGLDCPTQQQHSGTAAPGATASETAFRLIKRITPLSVFINLGNETDSGLLFPGEMLAHSRHLRGWSQSSVLPGWKQNLVFTPGRGPLFHPPRAVALGIILPYRSF